MFQDRQEAGQLLAEKIAELDFKNAVVYALPRGGVVLGLEVAKKISAPLDLVIARKIGHPQNPEYAICAITEDGQMTCNEEEKKSVDPRRLEESAKKEMEEAKRRRNLYLKGRPHILATGKKAIIVDDGIATGLTIIAAVKYLKKENPSKIIVAVPVAPKDAVLEMKRYADQVVALESPEKYLGAVGAYYRDFPQVSDQEVIAILMTNIVYISH